MERDATVLPNLFVAGAQKCGTTSLHRVLESHPEVFFPSHSQEIHFFDVEANFEKGVQWYAHLFAEWAGQRYIAQTSPLYVYEPAVAERIAGLVPDARLAFILRNPIDRAYSHYWHEVRYGWERLPFREALAREDDRLKRGFEARRHYSYVDRGRYSHQLKRYFKVFPRDKIHIEITEQFSGDLEATKRRLAAFLGIAADGFQLKDGEGVHNQRKIPRVPLLQQLVREWPERHPRLYGWVENINLRSVPYPPMESEDRKYLGERLWEDVMDLHEVAGISPDCWTDFV